MSNLPGAKAGEGVILPGRRIRTMQDKKERIFEAAATLSAEKGFENVGTQEISDRADVAAGTLFRYAKSKSELLLMVYNETFRDAIAIGKREAHDLSNLAESVFALAVPVMIAAARHPKNSVAYQRELMFGAYEEKYRAEALELITELEEAISGLLVAAAQTTGVDKARLERAGVWAARSVFAVLHLRLPQSSTGAHSGRDASDQFRAQVAQLVAGFFASLAPLGAR